MKRQRSVLAQVHGRQGTHPCYLCHYLGCMDNLMAWPYRWSLKWSTLDPPSSLPASWCKCQLVEIYEICQNWLGRIAITWLSGHLRLCRKWGAGIWQHTEPAQLQLPHLLSLQKEHKGFYRNCQTIQFASMQTAQPTNHDSMIIPLSSYYVN